MDERKDFNWRECPLEKTSLIEASAGTGKTVAITRIFLRLLLERRLPVSEILVVTYTVAATDELRDRIRRTIRAACDAFAAECSDDPFFKDLLEKYSDHAQSLGLLKRALRNFDEAPIYTIHGFCSRVLQENAFESMGLFDTELVSDERLLVREIVEDFWRLNFYSAPEEFVAYAMGRHYSTQEFLKLSVNRLSNPDMRIKPEAWPVDLAALDDFHAALNRVREAWPQSRDEVLAKLRDPALNKAKFKNPEAIVAGMDGYVDSAIHFPLFDRFEKLTVSGLQAGTNKGKTMPEHHFFGSCEALKKRADELQGQIEARLLFLKTELFRYLRQELPRRKQKRNIQFYDDLLLNLKDALEKADGRELAGILRQRYRAALIDEFQDTDPIQYAIFQGIFGNGQATLFLIGDPKQSIYSFRGADLFAYMRAAKHVDFRYTLRHNWRSEPKLIEAVNAIFSHPPGMPFLYREIGFYGVDAADVRDRQYLTVDGRSEAPFHLWYVDGGRLESEGAKGNKQKSSELIIEAVSGEIVSLLNLGRQGRAVIGDRPLMEEDIAVLVRTNDEARHVQDALAACGVPCVLNSRGNLFDSYEAVELKRILAAIEDCRSADLIKAALATEMMGIKGEVLDMLQTDEAGWDEWSERFQDYNDLWEKSGFIEMFRYLISRENVRERLLAFPDGERRLTNILHLMEVLHTESVENRLGMDSLIKWLDRQMDPDTYPLEEHELRLESDARAVKVVTIHKSKGLEYPVVFCPFNWGGSTVKDGAFTYHDPGADWQLNLVLADGAESTKILAEKEALAENIRLFYVAVTRAKNRCYLVWGPFKDAGSSAVAYVLHAPEAAADPLADIVSATKDRFAAMSDADIRDTLLQIAGNSDGAMEIYDMPVPVETRYMPPPDMPETLSCRTFAGIADRDRRIASFSYLLHDRTAAPARLTDHEDTNLTERPDYDDRFIREELISRKEPEGIFAFAKGARAGNLLHEILQQIDFCKPDGEDAARIVRESMQKYGEEEAWMDTLCRMVENVARTPLPSGSGRFTLSEVKKENRVSEMAFHFPLRRLTQDVLERTLKESGLLVHPAFPQHMGRLTFQPVHGFMKGFMDLVFCHEGWFYLADWKSNYLGPDISDYGPEALTEAMQGSFYILQYHLYLIALNQYLKNRVRNYDYDKNFGGVFYIFLRGLDLTNGGRTGVFCDRPPKKTVDYLSNHLIECQEY